MKPVIGLFLVSLVWLNVACFPYLEHEWERTALGDSIDKATLKTLHEAYKAGDDKNVVTSPLGVMLLLSLYANGAGDGSKHEINTLLGGGDSKKNTESYGGLSQELSNMDPSYLTVANKIYVAKQYQLSDSFSSVARSAYGSEVEQLDFTNPPDAAAVVNKWADEKTQGHIKDPVSDDTLTPDTAAALFNVIFFQGHWHVPFKANETKDEDFHVDKSTTVKKPTMKLLQSLFYTESEALGAKMIELPYKEHGFRMVVVLPNEVDGLPSVLEKASQSGVLEDVFKLEPSGRDIDLELPKFEVKSKHDLNTILPKLGISKIFEEPASGIVKGSAIKVSKAFQEAFIKVDEEGATAGAFTGSVAVTYSSNATPPPVMKFSVDHPFLYLILHKDKVLFAGTYSH